LNAAAQAPLLFQKGARSLIGINIVAGIGDFPKPCLLHTVEHRKKLFQIDAGLATSTKRKSPALPGFLDEYLFRSVHFASLAI
jgi:hypothetical protein